MTIRKIHRFTPGIYKAVSELLRQLIPEQEPLSAEKFTGILKTGNTHIFIAMIEKKKIIGMLTLVTYNIMSGKKVWIEDVVVDESQRGKGTGKELMLHAIGFARSSGAASVELTSRPSRIAANKLYLQLGFICRETNVYKLPL